jgi:hypothetical protein
MAVGKKQYQSMGSLSTVTKMIIQTQIISFMRIRKDQEAKTKVRKKYRANKNTNNNNTKSIKRKKQRMRQINSQIHLNNHKTKFLLEKNKNKISPNKSIAKLVNHKQNKNLKKR